MSFWKRWLLALIGSAVICVLIIGVFFLASEIAERSARASCLENDGEWDYTAGDCRLPIPEDI